jgi:ankyrin repeat protein
MARNSLHVAAKQGDVLTLRRLLQADASRPDAINAYDHHGNTPLMYAVSEHRSPPDAVALLISHGASVHQVQSGMFDTDMPVMALAMRNGNPTKVRLLIEAGAPLNYSRRGGYGPLLDAMYGRSIAHCPQLPKLLKLLIDNNVCLDAVTDYRESALRVLSSHGRFDCIGLLLEAGADDSQLGWTSLMRAVALGTSDDVMTAISLCADLEGRDWWERTAFLMAVQTGDIEKVALLRDAGADMSAVGHCGKPSLFYAIESSQNRMLEWLLDIGADPVQSDKFGETALFNAVECDNVAAVEALLRKGAPLFVFRLRPLVCRTRFRRVKT